MDLLVTAGMLIAAVGVALAGTRGLLWLVFYLMVHRTFPVTIYWRPLLFTGALFWFWYLTPALVESRAAVRVLLFLTQ